MERHVADVPEQCGEGREAWDTVVTSSCREGETDGPMLFRRAGVGWPAVSQRGESSRRCWRGFERMVELVGQCHVDVMLTERGGGTEMVGDMEKLRLERMPFSAFWMDSPETSSGCDGCCARYLAQCPIAVMQRGTWVQGPVGRLVEDIEVPEMRPDRGISMSSINLWCNKGSVTSSLHYDFHQNMLCVVTGSKTVRLAPPQTISRLHARPSYHESANHAHSDSLFDESTVERLAGMYEEGPRVKKRSSCRRRLQPVLEAVLHPGDFLYIPFGWWHQVRSSENTTAVNFWWDLSFLSDLTQHNGGPMLRLCAQRLASDEKKERLDKFKDIPEVSDIKMLLEEEEQEQKEEQQQEQEHTLISTREHSCKRQRECLALSASPAAANDMEKLINLMSTMMECSNHTDHPTDAIVAYLYGKGPTALMSFFQHLSHANPTLLDRFLMHHCSPTSWEVLTTGLEGIDEPTLEAFYDDIYSCCEDRQRLTTVMLTAKERFSRDAMTHIIHTWLGHIGSRE